MFENKMDGKDVHVLKKPANPDSPLRVQVPGKGDHANIFPERIHNSMHQVYRKSGLLWKLGLLIPISEHSITAKWDNGRVETVDHPEKVFAFKRSILQLSWSAFVKVWGNFPPARRQFLLRLWKNGHQLLPLLVVHSWVVVPRTPWG